jgi:hypothetical protein
MTIKTRQEIMEGLFDESKEIAFTKGKSYSSDEDSLSNFKRNAERK